MDPLNEIEHYILLTLVRLGEDAYGVTVREELEDRAGRSYSVAGVYSALDRLEQRGLVESWLSEPTPERGGRAKKHFRISGEGARALQQARAVFERMWEGLETHPDLAR